MWHPWVRLMPWFQDHDRVRCVDALDHPALLRADLTRGERLRTVHTGAVSSLLARSAPVGVPAIDVEHSSGAASHSRPPGSRR